MEFYGFLFCFFGHVLFQFLCNLQQYCDNAYNKLNSHQQKEFINITKMNYIGEQTGEREGNKHTGMHSCTHAHTHTHTHTQFQTKIQAIKRPSKQINKKLLT